MSDEIWPSRIAEAESALARGDPDRTVRVLASGGTDTDIPIPALRLYARALRDLGRHREACEPLERLVALQPNSAAAEHNLAAARGDAGDAEASHDAARRALAKGGDAPETWLVLARALMALSRLAEAERAFRESLTRRPDSGDALRDLAQLLWMRDGDAAAALAVFDPVIVSNQVSEALVALRATVARDIVGDQAAYEQLRPALERDHGSAIALAACAAAMEFDTGRALGNPLALHVSDLGQHGQDQLAGTLGHHAQALDVNGHAFGQQEPDGGLDIQGIAPEPVHCVNVQRVAFTDESQQPGKARPFRRQDGAAHPNVVELFVKVTAHGSPL